jgi:hypothetical protein
MQYHVKLVKFTINPLKYYYEWKAKQKIKKLNLSKDVPEALPTKKPSRYLFSKQINKI